MCRDIVAYIRTWSNPSAAETQRRLILRYCKDHEIECKTLYEDNFTGNKYRRTGFDTNETGYFNDLDFPEWSNMMARICAGEIRTILVDTRLRLYRNNKIMTLFNQACDVHGTNILEVGQHEVTESKSVVVYHFTDVSEVKPRVVLTTIDNLYSRASQHDGWEVSCLLLDMTITKSEQTNLWMLLNTTHICNVIYVKSFYHLHSNMVSFWGFVRRLSEIGIRVASEEEGELDLDCEALLGGNLRVAIYDQSRSATDEKYRDLRIEKLMVFIQCRTRWTISGSYLDDYKDQKCPQIDRLIKMNKSFDLILMDSFSMINSRTNHFFKFQNKVEVPIFSLKEGGVNWIGNKV